MHEPVSTQPVSHLEGGFGDPVFDAQVSFRAIMDAFARPGTIAELGELVHPPRPVPSAAGSFLATLADYDSPVWLDAATISGGFSDWLSFHTGAPVVDDPADARFALVCDVSGMPNLVAFAQGTHAYPDRSATIILALPALEGGAALTLTGPGIETAATIAPVGLFDGFLEAWATNHSAYPCGIDLVLAAGTRAIALPRTTNITRR